MATFADAGKEITDLFTRSFPTTKELEVNFVPNSEHLSVSLIGRFNEESYEELAVPVFTYRPWGLLARTELSTPNSDGKTLNVEVGLADFVTPGLKGEFSFNNGKKAELSLGGVYRHFKFGGVSARLGIPVAAPKYIAASVQIENEDTNGFGIGGAVKVSAGEDISVDAWKALFTFKQPQVSGFFGAEQKIVVDPPLKVVKEQVLPVIENEVKFPANNIFITGGLMKVYEENKVFAVQGNYNITRDVSVVEFLFKKTFEDLSFYKIKAAVDGTVSTSRCYNVSHGHILLGVNADLLKQTGSISFSVTTNL